MTAFGQIVTILGNDVDTIVMDNLLRVSKVAAQLSPRVHPFAGTSDILLQNDAEAAEVCHGNPVSAT